MIWRILLLGLLGVLAEGAKVERPSEYYVVSEFFSDNGALFYYRVIDVKPDGPDTVIRYIRIAPLSEVCSRRVIVQSREIRLRGTSPADVAGKSNPCAVSTLTLDKTLKHYKQAAGILEAISFGTVARCGSEIVALGLPISESVQLRRLQRRHPEMARLWDLAATIALKAFEGKDIFNDVTESNELQLQRSGAALAPSLMSGIYDQGLAEATRGGISKWKSPSFRELLKDYMGPIRAATLIPQLLEAGSYQFTRYIDPVYPALAKSARIQDRIHLRLTIVPEAGEVTQVEPLSGHAMLIQSAITAAKQWRFAPGSVDSKSVNVVLDYSLRCP